MGRQRHRGAVAREVDGIRAAGERVAAADIEGGAELPARAGLAVRAESAGLQTGIEDAHRVDRRLHPPVDRLRVGLARGRVDVQVAVARRGVAGGGVVGHARRLVVGDDVVLDHVAGVVVVAGAPGGVLVHGRHLGDRSPLVHAVEPGGGGRPGGLGDKRCLATRRHERQRKRYEQ